MLCGYLDGMCSTLENRIVGDGPWVNVDDPELPEAVAGAYEGDFADWARMVFLRDKLKTAVRAEKVDGEAFLKLVENPGLGCAVKLDVAGVEADQVCDPDADPGDPMNIDGVLLDKYGNVRAYRMLKTHPGAAASEGKDETVDVPAAQVMHWFRRKRFGQHRGFTAFLPAIWLIAMRQDYIRHVMKTSSFQASRGGVLETDRTALDGEADTGLYPGESLPFEGTEVTVAPYGWRFKGFDASQPNQTLEMFEKMILQEIGRCVEMPLLVVMLNASGFNYSSARMDSLTFNRAISAERLRLSDYVVLPLHRAFWPFWARENLDRFPELAERLDRPPGAEALWMGGFDFLDVQKELPVYLDAVERGAFSMEDLWILMGKDPESQRAKVEASMKWLAGLRAGGGGPGEAPGGAAPLGGPEAAKASGFFPPGLRRIG